MPPDFVTPWARTIKAPTKGSQLPGDLPILEPAQATHQRIPTGTTASTTPPVTAFARAGGSGSPCSRHDSAILRAKPWASSTVSVMLRPSATSPGTSGLVATYPPSSSGSILRRIIPSLMLSFQKSYSSTKCNTDEALHHGYLL